MDAPKGNVKNPAIRRIHADIRELRTSPSDQYHAVPLEENLFEWHFTIRGPSGTDFEGGIYHGRILLPSDYPFKPPNIILLTPNGRFDVGKKICLSISAYHPEHWQPAWGIRLILEALISFLPTDPNGAVGSLDWTPEERKRLAKDSVTWSCPRCGVLSTIIPEVEKEEGEGQGNGGSGSGSNSKSSIYAEEIAKMYIRSPSGEQQGDGEGAGEEARLAATDRAQQEEQKVGGLQEEGGAGSFQTASPSPRTAPGAPISPATTNIATTTRPAPAPPRPQAMAGPAQPPPPAEEEDEEDKLLYLAIALFVAIVALVVRKVLRAYNAEA